MDLARSAGARIHAALKVPTHAPHPSPTNLQWSADGQAVLLTKNAIYILTPAHGIGLDTAPTIKPPAPAAHPNPKDKEPPRVPWFMTMIEFSRKPTHEWPDDCQEWESVAAGALDLSLRAATCSPSGLTVDAGCVLAVLNSNLELTLWVAAKHHIRGEWVKVADVTPFIRKEVAAGAPMTESLASRTMAAQVSAIAWSSQTDFGNPDTHSVDGSLLAAGTRAGTVVLLSCAFATQTSATLSHIQSIALSALCITHLAWSPWQCKHPGSCNAYLACGIYDGTVDILRIVRERGSKLEARVEALPDAGFGADGRGITGMRWIATGSGKHTLVVCKPGVVQLAALSKSGEWGPLKRLRLSTQRHSAGSSAFAAVAGIAHDAERNRLIVSLHDGSLHVVQNVSGEPTLAVDESDALSVASRTLFLDAEAEAGGGENMRFSDVNRVFGLVEYDGGTSVCWLHEASRPSDFSYKHDAKHQSMFVMARLLQTDDDRATIARLGQILGSVKAVSGDTPLSILRSLFLYLRDSERLARIGPAILDILRTGSVAGLVEHSQREINDNRTTEVADGASSSDVSRLLDGEINDNPASATSAMLAACSFSGENGDVRARFRKGLAVRFFGRDALLRTRLRFALADFCWKVLVGQPQRQAEYGYVAQATLGTISNEILRAIVGQLQDVAEALSAQDMPFVMHTVAQASLPGSPPDLVAAAHALATSLAPVVGKDALVSDGGGLSEPCQACAAEVKFEDTIHAKCANGHFWPRCTVTAFVLSTPMARTCCGCGRKAFMPPKDNNMHLPQAARCWVVEELLCAARRCLFCGNNYVSLL